MAFAESVASFSREEGENVWGIGEHVLPRDWKEAGRRFESESAVSSNVSHGETPEVMVHINGLLNSMMARLSIEEAVAFRKELNKSIRAARKFA